MLGISRSLDNEPYLGLSLASGRSMRAEFRSIAIEFTLKCNINLPSFFRRGKEVLIKACVQAISIQRFLVF